MSSTPPLRTPPHSSSSSSSSNSIFIHDEVEIKNHNENFLSLNNSSEIGLNIKYY